mgnify:CR=1 FL=1
MLNDKKNNLDNWGAPRIKTRHRGKRMFTEEELSQLRQSPYILSVTSRQISYGRLFYQEYWRISQLGFTPAETFEFLGLDPLIVGKERIKKVHSRIKKLAKKGTLYDEEADTTTSIAEQLKQKDSEIERLRQEVEFLKKKKVLYSKFKKQVAINETYSD